MRKSRYLEHPERLSDIMAAIQVMGTHIWDSRPIDHWIGVLGQRPVSVDSGRWEDVFDRHPEFFGNDVWKQNVNETQVSYYLRWRRVGERTIDPLSLKELSNEEIEALKVKGEYDKKKLARKALTPDQIGTLLNAAIELQDRAVGFEARSRWWLPIVISIVTALLGLLGVLVGAMLKTKV
jgi:hypothetical protein